MGFGRAGAASINCDYIWVPILLLAPSHLHFILSRGGGGGPPATPFLLELIITIYCFLNIFPVSER